MVFTDFNYMDSIPDDLPKINNNVEKNCKNSKLYEYYLRHNHNIVLSKIIEKNILVYSYNFLAFLQNCYLDLIKNDILDIVHDIIVGDNSNDEIAIAMVCIDLDRQDLLDIMVSKGFKINQPVVLSDRYSIFDFDLLSHAIKKKKIEIVKYILENGADYSLCNFSSIDHACKINNDDIFNYFMEMSLSIPVLYRAFILCLAENDTNKIQKIISKGFDINIIDKKILAQKMANTNIKIETIKYLLDCGLNINSDIFLMEACSRQNCDLVDFYLELGWRPSPDILKQLFKFIQLPMINILLKYDIDFSIVPINDEHSNIIQNLVNNGMDKDSLLNYYIMNIENKKSDPEWDKWFPLKA